MTTFPKERNDGLTDAYNKCAALRNLMVTGVHMEEVIAKLADLLVKAQRDGADKDHELKKLQYGLALENKRAEQLGDNCRWLIERTDAIHRYLCKGPGGTWQDRAELATAAARHAGLTMEGWQLIATAPRNCSEVTVRMKDGTVVDKAHWACDLSGNDQPAFKGWFKCMSPSGFIEIGEPEYWRPLK